MSAFMFSFYSVGQVCRQRVRWSQCDQDCPDVGCLVMPMNDLSVSADFEISSRTSESIQGVISHADGQGMHSKTLGFIVIRCDLFSFTRDLFSFNE